MRWSLLALATSAAGCFAQPRAPSDAPPSIDAAPMCPADYTMSNGTDSRYRLITAAVDFVTAARDCADDETAGPPILHHTHLAVLSDTSERDYLDNFGFGWVGLTDVTSPTSTWTWITDEQAMSPDASDSALWAPTEPNNLMTEHCSHFDSQH
ncbi:MAG: C-type lectin domain-containing protein, partial [Acidobacteriota bacterium]